MKTSELNEQPKIVIATLRASKITMGGGRLFRDLIAKQGGNEG